MSNDDGDYGVFFSKLSLKNTPSVGGDVFFLNVAVTVLAAFMVTVQGFVVPEHPPPLQPAKVESLAAFAVNFTVLPWLNVSPVVAPLMLPVPVPSVCKVMAKVAVWKL